MRFENNGVNDDVESAGGTELDHARSKKPLSCLQASGF